jgi:DNA-binding winged helix-turn-helix (wHTH) protein
LVKVSRVLRFGEDFEFDPDAYELRRGDHPLKVERIPLEILLLLIEERRRLVTREQIAERIWGKDVCQDTDNSINGAIRKIRLVLKDDPENPRYVQTVTGKGYRFIATVDPEEPQATAGPEISKPSSSMPAEARVRPIGGRWVAAMVGVLLLMGTLGVFWQWSPSPRVLPPRGKTMLAVLPFANLTGDPGQEYFSDGLTEEMIAQLGSTSPKRLGLIARTSVMHYKNSRESLD